MKLLDLRGPNPREMELPLQAICQIVEKYTNRKLIFEESSLKQKYDRLFKLALFPEPIGFVVVANEFIKKNTELCPYGGETILSSIAQNDVTYLLQVDKNSAQNARNYGDIGSLFCHLPDKAFLDQFEFKDNCRAVIQQANVAAISRGGRIYFVATQDIQPNTPIGYSYGSMYWLEVKHSPILFAANSLTEVNLATQNFRPLIGLYDLATGSTRLFNTQSRERDCHCGLPITQFLELFKTQSESVAYQNSNIDIILEIQECVKVLGEHHNGAKPTRLFIFSPAHQRLNCAPNPSSFI